MIRLKAFSDPLYGSETALSINPAWVVEVEDTERKLFPGRKYPATFIKLKMKLKKHHKSLRWRKLPLKHLRPLESIQI